MRVVLAALFRDLATEQAVEFLRDSESRDRLRAGLNERELDGGRLGQIPAGDYGDNLLQAILALRVKFPIEEATVKLETNIAMRERRR
jgi:hypothetical protein